MCVDVGRASHNIIIVCTIVVPSLEFFLDSERNARNVFLFFFFYSKPSLFGIVFLIRDNLLLLLHHVRIKNNNMPIDADIVVH